MSSFLPMRTSARVTQMIAANARNFSVNGARRSPLYFHSDPSNSHYAKPSELADLPASAAKLHHISGDSNRVSHAFDAPSTEGFKFDVSTTNRVYKPDVEDLDYMHGSSSYGKAV